MFKLKGTIGSKRKLLNEVSQINIRLNIQSIDMLCDRRFTDVSGKVLMPNVNSAVSGSSCQR